MHVASFKKDQQLVHMRARTKQKRPVEKVKNGDNFVVQKTKNLILFSLVLTGH